MNRNLKKIIFGMVHGGGSIFLPKRRRTLPPRDSVNRILIAALHGLGDVLYASSVFPLLKQLFPNTEIDIWVHSRAAEVLKFNPYVHKQYIYDEVVTRRDTEHFRFDRKKRKHFVRELRDNHYDLAIDCSWVWGATLMLYYARPQYLAGSSQHGLGFLFDAEYAYENISHLPLRDLYINILHGIGIIPDTMSQPAPTFYMSTDAKERAAELLRSKGAASGKRIFSLHTTAGWKEKEWDIAQYSALVKEIATRCNADIAVIGNGRRDREHFNYLRSENTNVIDALDLPLDATAGITANCSLHIGGDSFPMHLAAALGIPAVCIAGPTNPELFAPPKEKRVKILYHRLYCSAPDGERYCTRNAGRTCPSIDCLKDMGVAEVITAIEEILIDTYVNKKA